MSRIIIIVFLMFIGGMSIARAEAPFAPDPDALWQDAQESEELVYIDGVPSIVTTSANSPQSAAIANILMYLNDREENPWRTGVESMDVYFDSLSTGVGAYLEGHGYPDQMTPEEKEAVEIQIVLMWEEAGLVIDNLMEEDDILIDEENVPELDQWATIAQGEVQGEAKPPADYGLRYAYILNQEGISDTTNLQQISDLLKGFMKDRLYYDVTISINTDPTFAQYKSNIDGNMPIVVMIDDRFMTGVGYWKDDNDNDYIIVHDPLTSEIGIDIVNDDALPLDYVGDSEDDIIPGCQFILVGGATEDMEFLIIEQWEFDFSDLLDMLELE